MVGWLQCRPDQAALPQSGVTASYCHSYVFSYSLSSAQEAVGSTADEYAAQPMKPTIVVLSRSHCRMRWCHCCLLIFPNTPPPFAPMTVFLSLNPGTISALVCICRTPTRCGSPAPLQQLLWKPPCLNPVQRCPSSGRCSAPHHWRPARVDRAAQHVQLYHLLVRVGCS